MEDNRSKIIKILFKLGIEQPRVPFHNLRKILINIEKKYDIFIPNEYKEFTLSYDGAFFENEIEFKPIEPSLSTTKEEKQSFDGFYGLNSRDNIIKQIERYENRMPNCLIPIGECPGGNLICLGVKEVALGKIYFWDHENELEAKLMVGKDIGINNINLYWDNLYLVSETFIDFLKKLEISQNNLENGDIDINDIEIWLDDDLLDD